MTDFAKALQELAIQVARKAAGPDASPQESTDALKALTPYYALLLKQKGKDAEDTEPTFLDFKKSFDTLKAEINPDGAAPVPGRARRRN